MLAGIIFPRGFYCPGETWNAKNHPADRQGKGASCVVVVGDEVRLCQKVGQQMPREIIDRVHPSVILVKFILSCPLRIYGRYLRNHIRATGWKDSMLYDSTKQTSKKSYKG